MDEKNFLGLEGLKYFWTKIEAKVIKIIEDEIAQIIANAPEDLDTLKEIADWISTHEDSASAMNTAILANKTAISGKADKSHTHTKTEITDFPTSLKNPNALTINGKTYDGSSAVSAGVQTVANGGTGVTTQADINKAFIGDLEEGSSDVTDGTEFVSSWASDNGFAETTEGAVNKPYKRKFSKVWNYIKGKADSIYAASSHTHTKSEITDFPTSLPANGGTADRVTTGINYSGEQSDCISAKQTSESFNNSKANWASYIICNHGDGKNYYHQMLRFDFFNDSIQFQRRTGGELQGWKNVAILENINTWTNNQYFDETITPRQGTIDGATVSIGRSDGYITIGDTDNDNDGFTVINNDCKMLNELHVSGNCTLNDGFTVISGGCTIKNTSDNKYKSVVSGEITGTTLTLYLN